MYAVTAYRLGYDGALIKADTHVVHSLAIAELFCRNKAEKGYYMVMEEV